MLFMPEHVGPILSGRKTETRRLWKKPRAKVGSKHKAKTRLLSKDSFATLLIEKVWKERLGDISEESIYNEGYNRLEEYKTVLERANKRSKFRWDANLEVYAIKFKVVIP
jgi:hypothetical protein